jgi:hypothetical protein
MTETLAQKTCTPCRGGIPPLTRDEAEKLRAKLPIGSSLTTDAASSARFVSTISAYRSPSSSRPASTERIVTVFGGTGFIGRRVVRHLRGRGSRCGSRPGMTTLAAAG